MESTLKRSDRAKFYANFLLNDYKGILNKLGAEIDIIKPDELGTVVEAIRSGEITRQFGRDAIRTVILIRQTLALVDNVFEV